MWVGQSAREKNNGKAGGGPATVEDNMREGRNKTVSENIVKMIL